MLVLPLSPVRMTHLQQLPTLLRQQAHGFCIVFDGLLQDQVLLQQLQCAWLILVIRGRNTLKTSCCF